jgi:PAS domain S-box-containing protein
MAPNGREGVITGINDGHRWSLRQYMALFMAALLAVAAVAALSVRFMSEQDARQVALADANFASNAAAAELAKDLVLLQETTAKLALNPQIPALLTTAPGACNLTFSATGHLDIISPDGTVKCSSQARAAGPVYAGIEWLTAAIKGPTTAGPFIDPVTGKFSAVVASPVAGGLGTVAAIVALAPLATGLGSALSGSRQLEFLITTQDGRTVLMRSVSPDRWAGAPLAGTSFASSNGPDERRDLDGTTRLYGRSTVAPIGWIVFAGADEAAALSAADLSANRFLAIILAGVGIMMLVVFVVYRRITEPVRRLSLVMRGSTSGKAVDAVAGPGATEVTALAEDFDKLMETVNRELAERLKSEQAAQVSERNYRMLFEGHPQPMWIYDVDSLEFLQVNNATVEHYGYSHQEFLGMTIADIRPPQDVPKFLELVANPMPALDRTGPWRHLLKDGTTIQVLVTSTAVTFGDHQARLVLAEDLTEGQRLELELHQSQARAESNAELSRAKDEMVAMVSHEVRTPLASIVGFAELLVTREVTPKQSKEYLGVMLQEGRRLTSLINDFLDLRRIEGGHSAMRFAPADMTALINRAVDLMTTANDTPIEIKLPDDLPLVRVDSDAIFRVLTNLLSNARKYSPDGGAIVVGAGIVDGMLEVYVQDAGLGIPAEAISQLFRRFYRVESEDREMIKGTGLGLSIAKNIIEAHGGKINAYSEGPAKGGSRFVFTVPLAREHAQVGDVLVVEDDAGFAHLLEAELAARGLSSVWAADAETAEQLMTKRKARAVVLDLLLPGLSGEAFLARLRATHGPGIPVVVVTLKDLDAQENMTLQKAGVTAVLRKGPGIAESAANLIAKSLVAELVAS